MAGYESRLDAAFARIPVMRSRDLVKAGISRIELSRALAAGRLQQLARGVYCLKDYRPSEHGDLALVMTKAPDAVVCLLSALRVHGLTTQAPSEIWIALGSKDWAPKIDYPRLRIVRFGETARNYGVTKIEIDGIPVHITTVEKTIADCFKFRNKVGLDVALEALRDAMVRRLIVQDELWRCAKVDRVTSVIRPYLEALA
jgi:predicted transcriptional regulator of viral defense system